MSKLTLILSISLFIIIINPSKDLPSPLSSIFLSFTTVLNDGWRHSERSDLLKMNANFLLVERCYRLRGFCMLGIGGRGKLNTEPSAGFENFGKLEEDKTVRDRYA